MNLRIGGLRGVNIAGVGTATPSSVADAVEPQTAESAWQSIFGTDWRAELTAREWSEDHAAERFGVALRHVWPRTPGKSGERAFALALHAAQSALTRASMAPRELNAIVVGTATAPLISASMAAQLGSALQSDAAILDVRAGGASGLAAWTQGAQCVAQGSRAVLVVAFDIVPEFLAPDDYVHRLLFSCGAAAFVLRAAPGRTCGLEGSVSGRAVANGRPFTIPGTLPPSADSTHWFDGPDATYATSLDWAWTVALDAYREFAPNAPDHFIPYAVTRDQLMRVGEHSGLSVQLSLDHLSAHGCLGNASVMFQMADRMQSGLSKPGDRIGAVAVGGGIAWQALSWRL